MRKTFLLLAAMCCLVMNHAMANTITYNASKQLTLEATSFTPNFTSHTFSNGAGTITFSGDVTTIGEYAFANCKELVYITLPNTVATIDDKAFYFCTNLKTISLPSSVTRIDVSAFMGCSGLKQVTINATSPVIKEEAFSGCTGLVSVTVPNAAQVSRTAFNYVNNVVYNGTDLDAPWGAKCKNGTIEDYFVYSDATKTKLCGYSTLGSSLLTLPASVTSIGKNAFYNFGNLENIFLPDNLTTIEESAFYGCTHLKNIALPAAIKTLGDSAFAYCYGLTKMASWPSSVPTTGSGCFYRVKKAIPLYVPKVSTYSKKDQWKDFTNIIALAQYHISVKGIPVTNYNQEDIVGDSTVSYDHDQAILTLKKASLACEDKPVIEISNDLRINCIGDNMLSAMGDNNNCIVSQNGGLIFSGSGSISIYSYNDWNAIKSDSLSIGGGCTVDVSCSDNAAIALGGKLRVDNASLIAYGNGKTTTIMGCTSLEMENGVGIRSNHFFDSKYSIFTNTDGNEAKDNIIIGVNGGSTYTITATATNGTVTGAGDYQRGDSVTLTATPNQGYEFKEWSDGTKDNPYTFLVTENVTLEAVFKEIAQGLDDVNANANANHKLMRDGQLLILRNGKTYNAQGTRL